MAIPNDLIRDISNIRKRMLKDFDSMVRKYAELTDDMNHRFKDELSFQKGNIHGLEDFFSLVMVLKKNNSQIQNSASLFKRMKDISTFNISEDDMPSKAEEKEIKEILED